MRPVDERAMITGFNPSVLAPMEWPCPTF